MPNSVDDRMFQGFDRLVASDGGRMITSARNTNITYVGNVYFQGSSGLPEMQRRNPGFCTEPTRLLSSASLEANDVSHDSDNTDNYLSLRELDNDINDNKFRSDDKVETWIKESEVHVIDVVKDANQDQLSSILSRGAQETSATTMDVLNPHKRVSCETKPQLRLYSELEPPAIEIISSITNSRCRYTVMRMDKSQENWISDWVLNDCGIAYMRTMSRVCLQFPRKIFMSKGTANITWYCEKKFKSRSTIFHVATTTLFDVLFGGNFLDSIDSNDSFAF